MQLDDDCGSMRVKERKEEGKKMTRQKREKRQDVNGGERQSLRTKRVTDG